MRRNMQKAIERGHDIATKNRRRDMTAFELHGLMSAFENRLEEMDARSAIMMTLGDAYYLGLATDAQPKKRAS